MINAAEGKIQYQSPLEISYCDSEAQTSVALEQILSMI